MKTVIEKKVKKIYEFICIECWTKRESDEYEVYDRWEVSLYKWIYDRCPECVKENWREVLK